jgi:hypothetical protein
MYLSRILDFAREFLATQSGKGVRETAVPDPGTSFDLVQEPRSRHRATLDGTPSRIRFNPPITHTKRFALFGFRAEVVGLGRTTADGTVPLKELCHDLGLWFACFLVLSFAPLSAWKNPRKSDTLNTPVFGTHDWIAFKGFVLAGRPAFIKNNLNRFFHRDRSTRQRVQARERRRGLR